jgi:plastocyanin
MRVLRLAGAAVVIAGCGGGDGGSSPQASVARVDVSASPQSTSICGTVTLTATPRDAQGNALARSVTWSQSNASILSLSGTTGASVTATGVGVGTTNVTATSETIPSTPTAVGVTTGGQAPMTAAVSATSPSAFAPTCVTVRAGGTVTWTFGATGHNVVFDSPKPSGVTDIADEKINTTDQRTFQAAGHYPYQCTFHSGMRGRVVVQQ